MANQNLLTFLTLATIFSLLPAPIKCSNILYSDLGGTLEAGKTLTYRHYRLVMQADCNLVLYNRSTPIWSTDTAGSGQYCFLKLHSNGLLQILDHIIKPIIWTSGVQSDVDGSYALVVQYDGSLHVHGPAIWSNPTDLRGGTIDIELTSPSTEDSVLWVGDVAPLGATVVTAKYLLFLHENCNLTLSNKKTGELLWYTDTKDPNMFRDCYVTLESNGEMRLKFYGGETMWQSGVEKDYGAYVLALQPDGNLVVYAPPIWTATESGALAVPESSGEKIAMVTE